MSSTRKAQPQKKPPGRLARAGHKAAAAAAPPASALAVSGVADLVTHTPYAWLTAGGISVWYGRNAVDALRERRSGGPQAARRRRQFQGTATTLEITRNLSAGAARDKARLTRPSLTGRIEPADAGVLIGHHKGQAVIGTHEDSYAAFGAPRSGKSGWMGSVILDAPGAVLCTSTRTDQYLNTAVNRARSGPVLVLNPGGEGGIATNVAWDIIAGCEHPATAIERAGYLVEAAPSDKGGKDDWWQDQGHGLLKLAMHAGGIAGASMHDVRRWVLNPSNGELGSVLSLPSAAAGWAEELESLTSGAGEQLAGIIRAAAAALSWMADPAVAAMACPQGDALDLWQFIAEGGTLYLIGTDKPYVAMSRFFACLGSEAYNTAKLAASMQPAARCDPPFAVVADEPVLSCPMDLPRMSAEAAGHGITLVTGFQSRSQLAAKWGDRNAETLWNNFTVKLIFGGFTHDADLKAFSEVCGQRDTWEHVKGPDGKTRQPGREPLYYPEQIRVLGEGQAIILHRRTRSFQALVQMVWDRPDYERAGPGQPLPDTHETRPAIEAAAAGPPAIEVPRRQPIALPGAAPVSVLPASAGHPVSLDRESPEWLSSEPSPAILTRPSAT